MNRLLSPVAWTAVFIAIAASLPGQVPASWHSRGVGAGGALYSPSINPANDSEYYLASDMSELYHTTDFGNSYGIVHFLQVQGGHESGVRFTSNPLIAYTVTYTGGNNAMPAKTVDGGATWQVLAGNPLPGDDVYSIWADYNNPAHVVVAGYDQIYFSANGGASFSPVSVTMDTSNGALVSGAFFDGNNIYLGTNAGLLVSTNGGTSFVNAGTPGIPAGELMLSFTGAKVGGQMRFFCLTAQSAYPGIDLGSDYYGNFRGIYSLDNGTGSWTPKNTGLDVNNDFLLSVAMAWNDLNTVYAAGGSSAGVPVIYKTTNAGGMWTNTFHTANNQNINTGWSGTGGDRGWGYGEVVFGLAVAPNNAAKAIFTDYGFVHRTSDGGTTWQQAYVSPADQHPVNTTAIAGGSYHSIGLEDTTAWQVFWTDTQHLFAGFSDIKGVRSTDGGVTWSLGYTGHNANSMYRIVQHTVTHALYAATSDIHDMYQSTRLADSPLNNADANGKVITSTDAGATWQLVHNFGHPVFWLSTDPTNANRMYASVVHSTAGGIFVSSNIQNGATSTWTKLANPPRTEGHPASIVVLNDGKVVCTYSGHRAPGFTASSGVFVYDPGTTTWTDVSAAGMLYWTKDLVVDPIDATQNTWYVGVFSGWGGPPNGLGGLYRTTDRGAHWTRINSLDRVTAVAFNPTNPDEAYLTTETDGLWHTSNIHVPSPAFSLVTGYPFRQPERVFFNPYDPGEIWITSFGNGLMVGKINGGVPPAITLQPVSQAVAVGATVTFTAGASGTPAPTYQWRKNGVNVAGATGPSLTLMAVSLSAAGTYTVVATNSAGTATSSGAVLTVQSGAHQPVPSVDFDGDGHTELLWRNTNTTQISAWTSSGGYLGFGPESGGWQVAAVGDFDGDGRTELLWRNTVSGQISAWTLAGGFLNFAPESGGWQVFAVGDFDGDGRTEPLWRNTVSGQISAWTMAGGYLNFGPESGGWQVIAVGDFDGDGRMEPLWRNSGSTQISTWTMAGGYLNFGPESGGWQVIDVGDFDGDGRAEPLWRNSVSGQISTWTMAGGYLNFGPESGGWSVIDVGDYDGDGRTEPLWRNSVSGQVSAWTMAGGYFNFGPESGGWQVIRF